MSRRFLKKYSAFQRNILMEFMKPEELAELDKKYNIAKVERALRELKKEAGIDYKTK
jgi:hypothetical protein